MRACLNQLPSGYLQPQAITDAALPQSVSNPSGNTDTVSVSNPSGRTDGRAFCLLDEGLGSRSVFPY